MYHIFLFLHIMGAIAAFGPSFTFPIIGKMMKKNPEHRLFALETMEVIHYRLIFPVSLTLVVSGAGLMWVTGTDIFRPWLLASVIIFALAFAVSFTVQAPAVAKMIEVGRAATSPGPGAQAMPRPDLSKVLWRARIGRHILTVFLFATVALMIWQPGD